MQIGFACPSAPDDVHGQELIGSSQSACSISTSTSIVDTVLEGTARKRAGPERLARALFRTECRAQSRLDYWESREDKESNQKPRGAIKVRGASPLNDKARPYSLVTRAATPTTRVARTRFAP